MRKPTAVVALALLAGPAWARQEARPFPVAEAVASPAPKAATPESVETAIDAVIGHGTRPAACDDSRYYGDARIAAIRAGLPVRPAQEGPWKAFEEAMRSESESRALVAARGSMMEEARARAEATAKSADAARRFADALGPLDATLDEGQRRRLASLYGGTAFLVLVRGCRP